jgi:lipopolysaccharide transport system ATP-binding protein
MSNPVIQIEGLGKRYQLTQGGGGYRTLRESLVDLAKMPLRKLRGQSNETREDFWALKDINLEIGAGEVVGVIGRNGAGKSTFLKILSQITKPTCGSVKLHGRVGSLLEVGTGFHPELTGRENIFLNGAILGMSRREISSKFDEIVDFAEISQFLDTPVKRYSSGMYVRLAFAVAAHLEPEILVIDEVLAVGDAAFQRKCMGKMGQVAREGRTILFVSHNMAAMQNLCTRAVLLTNGQVTMTGPTASVIDAYMAEIGSLSEIPLRDRKDRSGKRDIICTAIEILDEDGNSAPTAVTGRQMTARIHYESKTPRMHRNSRISLSVHKDEHVYFLLSTELVDTRQLDLFPSGYLDFIVPELPLSAGEYYLVPFIECNNVIQDCVIGAAQLSVIDGDFYGTGRNYPNGWQGRCVLVKHSWQNSEVSVLTTNFT